MTLSSSASETRALPFVHVLGLGLPGENGVFSVPDWCRPLLDRAEVLIGGQAALAAHSGHPAEKLVVDADTEGLYAAIRRNRAAGKRQLVLCGGDPLFFGLGARLAGQLGREAVRVVPGVSSLQAAAACLGLSWEHARTVSLHGRSFMLPLAHALISGDPVFVLTDAASTPSSVASWMLERGCAAYVMHVLDDLHYTAQGDVRAKHALRLTLDEAAARGPDEGASARRVLFLEPSGAGPARAFGLGGIEIAADRGLVTKAPVRAAGLAALGIEPGHTVWDLGAGSGGVGVEAARLAWRGQVFAVERKEERLGLIRENRKRFSAANLEVIQGEFPFCLPGAVCSGQEWDDDPARRVQELPCPDRIFLGGGLSGSWDEATETLSRCWRMLLPGGRLLAHCILLSSLERARAILLDLGAHLTVASLHASTSTPLGKDMRLEGLNPVFLVLGEKQA